MDVFVVSKKLFLFFILVFFLMPLIFAVTGVSSSYTLDSKLDYGAVQTEANSSNYTQRFISGEQPVSQYTSSSYSGRFGILSDTTAPIITLIAPADSHSTTSTSITFEYNVTAGSSTNCSLIIDGSIVATNSSVLTDGSINTFTQTLSVATHTWSVNCTDSSNNQANSSSRTLTITSSGGGTTGGGGGGSSSVATTTAVDFDLGRTSYETTISLDYTEYGKIAITNREKVQKSFNINKVNLDGILFLDKNIITIGPGESGDIEFTINAPEKVGIYTGKIIVSSGSTTKEILVVVNVRTDKSLFDVSIKIPKKLKSIRPGSNLEAQIDLLQAGIKEKMDVVLNYIIKDFTGVVYVEEVESIMVYDQKSFTRSFHTEDLPPGNYVLGLELIYPGGVAVASSQFKVKEPFRLTGKHIVISGIIITTIMSIALMWLIIKKYKSGKRFIRKRKKRRK